MTGAYRVVVQNRKIKFDFEIRRNITILRGDSATGKTTLVEMIREYEELGPDSGIELQCEKDCVVLSGRQWKKQLSDISQSSVFIDEGNAFTSTRQNVVLPTRNRSSGYTLLSYNSHYVVAQLNRQALNSHKMDFSNNIRVGLYRRYVKKSTT